MNHLTRWSKKKALISFLNTALCAALVLALSATHRFAAVFAEPPESTIHPDVRPYSKALAQAARFVDSGSEASIYLARIGYTHPGIAEEVWNNFPAIRKIETAMLAAERANKGSGSDVLLLLINELQKDYPLAAGHPAFATLTSAAKDAAPLRFSPLTAETVLPVLEERYTLAIAKASTFFDGGSGLFTVLTQHFRLTSGRAFDIVRASNTVEEALLRGFNEVPAAERDMAMTWMVSGIDQDYRAARTISEFEPWRKRDAIAALVPPEGHEPHPPSVRMPPSETTGPNTGGFSRGGREEGHPPFPPGNPAASGRPGPAKSAEEGHINPSLTRLEEYQAQRSQEFKRFINKSYGPLVENGIVNFSRIAGEAKGFGGIIFGSPVKDGTGKKVKKIHWTADPHEGSTGSLQCTFVDGETASFAPVLAEDAFAAYRIVFSGVQAAGTDNRVLLPAIREGEAIGLVGIHDPIPYFECGAESIVHDGRRWKVVMHPAVADMPNLGRSILMCDVLPLDRESTLVRIVRRELADQAAAKQLGEQFSRATSTYKFLDVPTTVSKAGSRLLIERTYEPEHFPDDLRRNGFITFEAFDGAGEVVVDERDTFYPLVPALTAAYDYDRLNGFARTLALFRWAKGQNAVFDDAPPQPHLQPVGESVITSNGTAILAPDFDPEVVRLDLTARVQAVIEHIANSDDVPTRSLASNYREVENAILDSVHAQRAMFDGQRNLFLFSCLSLIDPAASRHGVIIFATMSSVQSTALEQSKNSRKAAEGALAKAEEESANATAPQKYLAELHSHFLSLMTDALRHLDEE